MSLQGFFEWFTSEVRYVLFIILIIVVLVTAYKRAWIAMIGSLVGLAFIGIFVLDPNKLLAISEWLGSKLSIGGS
jgi:nicotinamide riboside transporter PnuC